MTAREMELGGFRKQLYATFESRRDSLFELTDAILTAGNVPSPPHLSPTSIHRRRWGSLYAALSKGEIDAEALRQLSLLIHWTLTPERLLHEFTQ